MRDLELYIFHIEEEVVIVIFEEDKYLKHISSPKKSLGEELVENFEWMLEHCEASLDDIDSIFLSNSFSTWNASRLVTLFVKTLTSFKDISLYLKQESSDKKDIDLEIRNFPNVKKSFKLISVSEDVAPLYKKCPNINI